MAKECNRNCKSIQGGNMNELIIKRAESEDWNVIQQLNNEVYLSDSKFDDDLDLGRPFSDGGIGYLKKLASGEYGKCMIAYLDKEPVGYIAMSELKFDHRKSKYIEIENMGVSSEHRSQGIGKMLIKEAKKWARELGTDKIFVVAYYKNDKAVKFYKREGFEEIGLEMEMNI